MALWIVCYNFRTDTVTYTGYTLSVSHISHWLVGSFISQSLPLLTINDFIIKVLSPLALFKRCHIDTWSNTWEFTVTVTVTHVLSVAQLNMVIFHKLSLTLNQILLWIVCYHFRTVTVIYAGYTLSVRKISHWLVNFFILQSMPMLFFLC